MTFILQYHLDSEFFLKSKCLSSLPRILMSFPSESGCLPPSESGCLPLSNPDVFSPHESGCLPLSESG
uniref:Uncharacterized protein n=1 Tax=Acrobeloides nanus TaxID=290746 RepID=A0A914DSS6_9BILA